MNIENQDPNTAEKISDNKNIEPEKKAPAEVGCTGACSSCPHPCHF